MSEGQLTIVGARTVQDIVNRRDQIKSLMASVMEDNQHYGKIPGCGNKPTLLQPGAQLLAQLFGLRPEYEIVTKDLENGHREFTSRCRMFYGEHKAAEGVGICSTMESKYRYRNAAAEIEWTGHAVPKEYWDKKRANEKAARDWLAKEFGEGAGTKKNDKSEWEVVIYKGGDGKVENPNIADCYNTCLKISKKRSFVDATITATASSDFFTQDLEDIAENMRDAVEVHAERVTPQENHKPTPEAPKTTQAAQSTGKAQDPQQEAVAHLRLNLGTMGRIQEVEAWLVEKMIEKKEVGANQRNIAEWPLETIDRVNKWYKDGKLQSSYDAEMPYDQSQNEAPTDNSPKITFGKYQGSTLSQVLAKDREYVKYLAESAKDEALRDAAKALLG